MAKSTGAAQAAPLYQCAVEKGQPCGWIDPAKEGTYDLSHGKVIRCGKPATSLRYYDIYYWFCDAHAAEFDGIVAEENRG